MSTPYHAKYFAHELTRQASGSDPDRLSRALFDAQVDLNPHQIPHHAIEVCGELAGNPKVIPLFLEMEIRHLSVHPLRIPATKEIIRTLRVADDGGVSDGKALA